MRGLLDVVPDSPAGPARGSAPRGGGGGGSGDASFDTNMVIILAALLCALIFALGLNSIARFALRCGRRLAAADASSSSSSSSSAAAAAAEAEGGTTGLKRRALRRIPVEVYGRGGGGGGAGAGAAEGDGEGAECAICLGEFTDGEKVRVLPTCRHGFHVRCIDTWLAEHSSCPTCRSSLLRIDPRGGVGTAPPQLSGSPSPPPVAAAEGR